MTNDLITSAWAPGLICHAISSLMYGASLGQSAHYVYLFPKDQVYIKLLVLLVFIADALHLVGACQFYWTMVVWCHRSAGLRCESYLPWGLYIAVPMNYVITFAVQCFYCHRVWIISGNNKCITRIILLVALLQFALGTWATTETVKHGTIEFLYTTRLVPVAAGVSTVCDIMITCTIFKYLWRSELRSRSNILRDLVVVFINMGVLTCLISIIVGVVFAFQGNHYWVGAPASIISRCYVNSLLSVLNARHRIRERESRRLRYAIEMPTLTTITV